MTRPYLLSHRHTHALPSFSLSLSLSFFLNRETTSRSPHPCTTHKKSEEIPERYPSSRLFLTARTRDAVLALAAISRFGSRSSLHRPASCPPESRPFSPRGAWLFPSWLSPLYLWHGILFLVNISNQSLVTKLTRRYSYYLLKAHYTPFTVFQTISFRGSFFLFLFLSVHFKLSYLFQVVLT